MLIKKLQIKVFTLSSQIWFNHAFLLLSRKWKARLTDSRPWFLNPSMFQRKPLRLRKYQERLESCVKERRISIASCESESGISWPITLCKLGAGSAYSTCKLNISRTLLESFKVHYNISSLFHKFSLALLALSNIRNKFLSEYIHINFAAAWT